MTSPEVPTRPAANERSPNRQPRYRGPVKDWLRVQEQETFIRVYREAGWQMACAAIQRTDADIRHWIAKEKEANNGHSLFLEKIAQAKALRQELLEAQREDLTPVAVEVMDKTMKDDSPLDRRLRFDAARTHLKGVGFYTDKAAVEHTGPGGAPVEFTLNIKARKDASDEGT